jgi:hypothetical protein
MASSVDVSGAIRFDLASGTVHIGDDARGVVVPADLLAELVKDASPDARRGVARKLGAHLGRRMARRAGSERALLDAGLEHAASLLAAELALAGLGSCNLERWGRALIVHVTETPSLPPDFTTAMIEGALGAAVGRSLACALLSETDGVRVLVTSEKGAQRVRGWLEQGTAWSDAVARLQSGAAS